jgi:hypothetical protein
MSDALTAEEHYLTTSPWYGAGESVYSQDIVIISFEVGIPPSKENRMIFCLDSSVVLD